METVEGWKEPHSGQQEAWEEMGRTTWLVRENAEFTQDLHLCESPLFAYFVQSLQQALWE